MLTQHLMDMISVMPLLLSKISGETVSAISTWRLLNLLSTEIMQNKSNRLLTHCSLWLSLDWDCSILWCLSSARSYIKNYQTLREKENLSAFPSILLKILLSLTLQSKVISIPLMRSRRLFVLSLQVLIFLMDLIQLAMQLSKETNKKSLQSWLILKLKWSAHSPRFLL